jgi:hypothetical protein
MSPLIKRGVSEKHFGNLRPTTRDFLQMLQGKFNPDSIENEDRPYYLFFQMCHGVNYSAYKTPKRLSAFKRSFDTFKLSSNPKCLRLRYFVAQCSKCENFFSRFNTTKYWKTWETDHMEQPKISIKLLEKKGIILCTDCLWFYEALDELEEMED